ncbi:activator of basal transcription 1 [Grus americana]|uniref:activator of basal transcription 1 n=1 Tax=Grus americana TaxID=9117 RepID=UPI0024077D05|nr:activator of basal transcription 1 [Grus americana]
MAAAERDPPQEEEEREEEEEEEEGEGGPEGSRPRPPKLGSPPEGDGCPPPKRVVPGVLYLSFIPPGFGPRQARALLGTHGELGRVFFQPQDGRVRKRRRRPAPSSSSSSSFAEAWVEFRDKRAAKRAAAILHGTPMAPRPRSPFRHHRWSLKYLPGFRWPHLSERLAYERHVRGQRLRAEVAQAKREGNFFTRRAPQKRGDPPPPPRTWGFAQRPTETEIWGRKTRPPPPAPPRRLLEKVFGGGDPSPRTPPPQNPRVSP